MMSALVRWLEESSVSTLGGDIQPSHRAVDTVLTKGWLTVHVRVPGLHTCVLTCDGGADDLVKLLHAGRISFILSRHRPGPRGATPSSSIQTDLIRREGGGRDACLNIIGTNVCLLHQRSLFILTHVVEVDFSISSYTATVFSSFPCLLKTLGCRNSKNE